MHKQAKKKSSFGFCYPMLAYLSKKVFSDKNWLFERKFDGIRVLALKKNKVVSLYSRNKNKINQSFPEVVEAFEKVPLDNFLVDGELVSLEKGVSNFSKLQLRMHVQSSSADLQKKVKVIFFVFDMLYGQGHDLKKMPLIERKKILKSVFPFDKTIRYTSHKKEIGKTFLKTASKKGWEGIIGKKIDSIYVSKRSKNWLKFKCINREEMIICGFTKPSGTRVGFGALLLGYYKKGLLTYAGKVGTGFNRALLQSLTKKLISLQRVKSPFKHQSIDEKNVTWVKPELVCQIEFTQWTKDGKLRHPSFLGLRYDKKAKDVKR